MNGYSKMKTISDTDTKSESMDFSSDFLSPSSSSPEIRNLKFKTLKINPKPKQIKNNPTTTTTANNNNSSHKTQDSFSFSEGEGGRGGEEDHQECNINYKNNNGEKFSGHVKLSRNSTVSASSSAASHALQSAVKRAFSMRRSSSSVSERYRRIHDQSVTLASPFQDEDHISVKKTKKNSKSKIINACKKLFGL